MIGGLWGLTVRGGSETRFIGLMLGREGHPLQQL
jgi:hypothetical protein